MSTVSGHKWFVGVAWLVALSVVVSCSEGEGTDNDGEQQNTNTFTDRCERDDIGEPETAADLSFGETYTGYICPIGDSDWYQFSIGEEELVTELWLEMSTGLTPVEPTYTVHEDTGGAAGDVVARANLADIGQGIPMQGLECIPPGDYLVSVRDYTDENEDYDHEYEFTVDTHDNPDPVQTNNSPEEAYDLDDMEVAEGYIGCAGDEDWYAIDVDERELVNLRLTMDQTEVDLIIEIRDPDGEELTTIDDLGTRAEDTAVERLIPTSQGGTYYFGLFDESGHGTDLEVPYELQLELLEDIDPNEPNDTPDEATELSEGSVGCSGGWTELTTWGTISAPGDIDWFRLPLEGCDNGLVEVEMVFDTDEMSDEEKWNFSHEIQADLRLIRPDEESPCEEAGDCQYLERSCSNALDCAGYGEVCSPSEGQCSAPRACLQEGMCGATQVHRHYDCPEFLDRCQPLNVDRPQSNRAEISAPIFGDDVLYIRAADFQAQAGRPQLPYDLRVRVRDNPDDNEPDNFYTGEPPESLAVGHHQEYAREIEVLDCTGDEPECCSNGEWHSGNIGYERDMAWFRYQHPCPDEDCTLAFHYEIEEGPVDYVFNVFDGGSAWQTLLAYDIDDWHGAVQGTAGGIDGQLHTGDTRCYYSSQQHEGEDFTYHIQVYDRTNLHPDGESVDMTTRHWDPDQEYRFCIEKVSDECEEPPCELYDDGCGPPQ